MARPERIVDAHHHLWDLTKNSYPWLVRRGAHPMFGTDYDELRRDYLVGDLLDDIGDLPILRSVHLQADHDPTDSLGETRWLSDVAASDEARGFPHAIVAYADFLAHDIADTLAGHAAYARVRGIRQTLHHRPGRPLENEVWRTNFGLLRRHGFSFDLQVYPRQLPEALSLVDTYDDIQFILPHSGLPQDRSDDGIADWRTAMRAFAERENVVVKMSGFGMLNRDPGLPDVAPVMRDLIEIFGPDRCLVGSNYPVDRLAASYRALWEAMFAAAADLSVDEVDQIFFRTATRVYRLDQA